MSSDSDDSTITTQEVLQSNTIPQEQEVTSDEKVTVDNHDHEHDYQGSHLVKDVIMWRRRKISALVLVGVTALWVLFQVYRFKFTPLASWVAMAFVTLLFLYGSVLRLLRKEVPDMREWNWELTEQRTRDMADSTTRLIEKGIRWMFNVSCEKEWYIFVGVVSALLTLAYLGHHFDLLTLLYTGTVAGLTVPTIYVKNQEQIKAYRERLRIHGTTLYDKMDERVFSKSKLKRKEKKDRKVE